MRTIADILLNSADFNAAQKGDQIVDNLFVYKYSKDY